MDEKERMDFLGEKVGRLTRENERLKVDNQKLREVIEELGRQMIELMKSREGR